MAYLVPAIIVQKGNPKNIGSLEDLARPGLLIGIADPESVCVGLYAKELLERNGLWERVSKNIVVYAASCEQTAQIVYTGAVDAVIGWHVFYYWNPDKSEIIWIESSKIPKIGYIAGAVTTFTKDRAAAENFPDFLVSEKVYAIWKKYGYFPTLLEAKSCAPNAIVEEIVGGMKVNIFRVTSLTLLALVIAFFLCAFTSPIIFVEPWIMAQAFISEETRFALFLSLFTATSSTLISLAIAYLLSRTNFRGKTLIEGFLDVPMAVPSVALGVMLLIFFTRNPLGALINENLIRFVFEVPGIILAQFAVISVLTTRYLKEVFDNLPARYENVARTLRYSEWEALLYIALPAIKRSILGTALLSWARSIGEFGASLMLAGATRLKTETLPIALYLNLVAADLGGLLQYHSSSS
ncbi:MAG: substrate-binding domain-containing protein [Candidatus Bathyarchaeia archaeon]